MSNGHREYSHRRPELFQTPYLIATWSANERAKFKHDRFHAHESKFPEPGPTPQERFEAAVARWHVEHPNG